MLKMDTSEYIKTSPEETFKSLNASADGLPDSEVNIRLDKFGYNEITEEKRKPLLEFLHRYWGPMPWLLELAMTLSFVLNHYIGGILIFILLTMNTIIGQIHSINTQKLIELLKKKLALKAKVLRDKKWSDIDAKGIVPGDIFSVKLGNIVPADAKVISGLLSVDQSAHQLLRRGL